MASISKGDSDEKIDGKLCKKSRRCSKPDRHPAKCNTERKYHSFWANTVPHLKHTLKRDFDEAAEKMKDEFEAKIARVGNEREQELSCKEAEITQLREDTETSLQASKEKIEFERKRLDQLKQEYDRVKILLQQTQKARSKRANNATTFEMVSSVDNTTRYRRRKETSDILTYIHGSEEGACCGAWDFIASTASKDTIDKFISNYKRGKYLQGVFGKAVNDFNNSDDALKQAVTIKYQNFLSRRKFKLICKTQSSVFNADKEIWIPRNIKCCDAEISLPKIVSDFKVDAFVKSLDIGIVAPIPNCSGVSRTVTGLLYMLLNLYIESPRLYEKLIWFNENRDHFVVQFSDDGAPETSELGMSIGSLTCWNFGGMVRSRDCHYLLHCLSVSEKDPVMEDLWKQHTDEMQILEGNLIIISGHQCTVEFQPSADQSWQSWANNELNQAATYPSPYANVNKGELNKMGKTIGLSDTDTWQPPTAEKRLVAVNKVNLFRAGLPKTLTATQVHTRELEFMAMNGLRQMGPPRIGIFADRQRPEPVHNEINAWQHLLNLTYKEAMQRGLMEIFLKVLSSPVTSVESDAGCGLSFVAHFVREHYNDTAHRGNNLSTRLIGRQAIALAKYGYRLVDCLEMADESSASKLKRQALAKAMQCLRNAGTLFNKVNTNSAEIAQLKENLVTYFNLLSLFFPMSVNITVWTMGYALPYHAGLLYDEYKVGYGIISLQAKESKHAGVKHDLSLTNRSKSFGSFGKWWQVMRANYVRAFYLPKHNPMPSGYISHYESRHPVHLSQPSICECGRVMGIECSFCESCKDVIQCAQLGKLSDLVMATLKPICCETCQERFPDDISCNAHVRSMHVQGRSTSFECDPRQLSVSQLRDELRKRGMSATGGKAHLVKRLSGAIL